MANITRIKKDLETLRNLSEPCEKGTTRFSYTNVYHLASDYLKAEMKNWNLKIWEDGVGNLFGEVTGTQSGASKVISGSHLDTVNCSGYFDGQAGIVCALEAARMIKENGVSLKGSFQVLATTMEEGSRFPNLSGSRFIAGEYSDEELDAFFDDDGISLRNAIINYGLDADLTKTSRNNDNVQAFLELHLEQGKKLENKNIPIGLVDTIYGTRWFTVNFEGATSHPSTPMSERKDTIIATSKLINDLSNFVAFKFPEEATVTFGEIKLVPNARNAVPGSATISIDIRSGKSKIIDEIEKEIKMKLIEIEHLCNVTANLSLYSDVPPTQMSKNLISLLKHEADTLKYQTMKLDSGAGHDAMVFATLWDTAMIFVPSKDGLTHCPEEWTDYQNLEKGANLIYQTILALDSKK